MHVTYTIDTNPEKAPHGTLLSQKGKLALIFHGRDNPDDIDKCIKAGRELGALFSTIDALSVLTLYHSSRASITPLQHPLFNVLLEVKLIYKQKDGIAAIHKPLIGIITFNDLRIDFWEWLYNQYLLKDMSPTREQSWREFESVCNFMLLGETCDTPDVKRP